MSLPAPTVLPAAGAGKRLARRRRFRPLFFIAAIWVSTLVLAAIFADFLPLPGPDVAAGPGKLPPFQEGGALVLGTDRLGRSELSRIIFGARSSLTIGAIATSIGAVVGGLLGLIAGYFRGAADAVIGAIANMVLALPGLVLLLAISAIFTPSLLSLLVGLGLLAIPAFMRISRAATLTFASREFVTAARALGASHRRIIFRELLPNVLLPVSSYAFLLVAVLIAAEGALSYLGVGVPPPAPSWGGMIADGQRELRNNSYLLFIPALTMFFTVYSLNILGDAARKKVNVREVEA